MIILIISTMTLFVMLVYLGFLFGAWKISSKNIKRKIIFCLSLVALCFITSMGYFLEGSNSNAILWLVNTVLWILNYAMNRKFYTQAIKYEERMKNR